VVIAPRASGRRSTDFAPGTRVVARPASVSRVIDGLVVGVADLYTVIVRVGGIEIAVDAEDCQAV
jgi:hypothetical protein